MAREIIRKASTESRTSIKLRDGYESPASDIKVYRRIFYAAYLMNPILKLSPRLSKLHNKNLLK